MQQLGTVKLVQVQEQSLKRMIENTKVYAADNLVTVESLRLAAEGIIGMGKDGSEIIDVHHHDHPHSRYRGDNGISVGLTGHYDAMRSRFGEHMQDGIAGENIIIDAPQALSLDDLQQGKLIFQNPDTLSEMVLMASGVIAPCEPFSQFCAGKTLRGQEMKETLQFLHAGRRGFLLSILEAPVEARVCAGDVVFIA